MHPHSKATKPGLKIKRATQHVHRPLPDMRRRTRRSVSTIGGGTPDQTVGRADAYQARARPYLRRKAERLGSIIFPLHTNDLT
jgi:hypothetical protein